MGIKLGKEHVGKLYTGSTQINNIAAGSTEFVVEPDYLCFSAVEATNISFVINYGEMTILPTIKYRKNNGSWTTYTFGTSISLAVGDKCYFKGNNTSFNNDTDEACISFTSTGNVKASGNIMSLLDETCQSRVIPCSYCFCGLFAGLDWEGCTTLLTAPKLPATTLANNCYQYMFYGCTSLTTPPELLTTTLAYLCYCMMFYGCTSLTTTPELPATTLAAGCYGAMFLGCTSLTSAPELHATTLANNCYASMFSGCTSLTTAPELSATTLTSRCYQDMFNMCTSLVAAPELPATTLADWCYSSMFKGCTSLTSAPKLPATTLTPYCYNTMLCACTSLTSAPELPATTLTPYCYNTMFEGCTSLTTAPELSATTLSNGCYLGMFKGCTSLQVSDTQTTEATHEWKVPTEGTFTNTTTYNQIVMFQSCLGTRSSDNMSGAQGTSHTYYTQNEPV